MQQNPDDGPVFDNEQTPPKHEPALNVPPFILAFLVLLVIIEVAKSLWVTNIFEQGLMLTYLSFDPFLYTKPFSGSGLPLVDHVGWWSPFTYSLLHGDYIHLMTNGFWMLAFGSIVARRFGTARVFLFCCAASLGGALLHFLSFPFQNVPMIGASAIVSGFMGAASRFAFSGIGRGPQVENLPALSLRETFSNRQTLIFIGVWFAINYLFGAGIVDPTGSGSGIAWQAHIGGMLVGLFGFSLFDRNPRH